MPKEDRRYPPIHPWLYRPLMAIIRFLVMALTRLHVTGIESVPTGVPLIYVTNHLHHLDSPVMGLLLPGAPRPLAAEKYMAISSGRCSGSSARSSSIGARSTAARCARHSTCSKMACHLR